MNFKKIADPSFNENKIISLTNCFKNILRIYLNEKLNFHHRTIERNAQMHIRKSVLLD